MLDTGGGGGSSSPGERVSSQNISGVAAPPRRAVEQRHHDRHHMGGREGKTADQAVEGRDPGEGMGGHRERGGELNGHHGDTTNRLGAGPERPALQLEHHCPLHAK
ncbi:MAG: hypothetical protein ACRDQZ_23940 [Mycobacteriales bacterium]